MGSCSVDTAVIARSGGVVRVTCDGAVHLPASCTVSFNNEEYGSEDLLVSNRSIAFVVRAELELGALYTVRFNECGMSVESQVQASAGG